MGDQDFGFDNVVKSASEDKKSQLSIPRNRPDLLAFLKQNVPSAGQCISKMCESVLSDGVILIPTKPNPDKSQKKELDEKFKMWDIELLIEEFLRDYLEYGDAYFYPAPSIDDSSVADLVILDPGKMGIRVDKAALNDSGLFIPALYEYKKREIRTTPNNPNREKGTVEYDIDEIIRAKRPSTVDPVYGMAPMEEEQASLIFGIRVLNHNLRFFQNLGKPPTVIHLNENTTRKEAEAYKRFFTDNYKGPNKAWETMISYGGTTIQELTLPDQTAFMDFLTYVRVQTCGLFGVPPFEVGVTDKSGLNNTETQHKDFIKTNINRKKKMIANILNCELLPRMNITDWQVYLPPMDAVSEKQRIELNAAALSSGQITHNEARVRNNEVPYAHAWADVPVIGDPKGVKGYVPLDEAIKNDYTNGEPSGDDDADPNRASGRGDLDDRNKEPGDSPNSDK